MTGDAILGSFRDGPFIGMSYRSPGATGVTDERGTFRGRAGEPVTFAIGELELGTALGATSLTVADLVAAPGFGPVVLSDPRITNRARFLQSFGHEPDLRAGVVISDAVHAAVTAVATSIDFDQDEGEFGQDPAVRELFESLGVRLRGSAEARNHLRRAISGITQLSDVAVPTRDGSHLLADVYHPLGGGAHPVIMRLSVYGKAFRNGSICSEEARERSEQREDNWFEGDRSALPPMLRYSETIVSANASTWVPRGYTLVRVDGRGVGNTPGVLDPFSAQEAEDYYDAIEWAARQPWSDGNVGLYGASYSATIQWNVAALAPPSLRAVMPFAGDSDAYRDLSYPGGIFNETYRRNWWDGLVAEGRCGGDAVDLVGSMQRRAFDDEDTAGGGPLSAKFSRITVPVLTAVSQTGTLHGRSGFEAFAQLKSRHKQLIVVDANYFSFLYRDCLPDEEVFFDRFLKGIEPERDPSPVRMIMRTGGGEFEWREEPTWPVPGTTYQRLFLDAGTPDRTGTLRSGRPEADGMVEYSADADASATIPVTSFLSDPLVDDLELAGHFGATLWVSTTAPDMDTFVALRVIDPDGNEVPYPVRARGSLAPVTWGCLKVSQRALDPERSTVDRPWHTHRRADQRLLTSPDEIVEIDVELMPATARVNRGNRLQLDITPVEGPGARIDADGKPTRRAYDVAYHAGALNRVHTGGARASSLRLPVVRRREPAAPRGD